jgi:hypothetical protein
MGLDEASILDRAAVKVISDWTVLDRLALDPTILVQAGLDPREVFRFS